MSFWSKTEVVQYVKDEKTPIRHLGLLLFCLYQRQTSDEQRSENTHYLNGVGFSGTDAAFLSSVAKSCQRYGYSLTPKMVPHVRKALVKYAGQLAEALTAGEVTLDNPLQHATQQHSRQPQASPAASTVKPHLAPAAPEPEPFSEEEWVAVLHGDEPL
jgi:hypothetical protein